MLIVYFVDFGVTKVVIPTSLQTYFGELLDLGMRTLSRDRFEICAPNQEM